MRFSIVVLLIPALLVFSCIRATPLFSPKPEDNPGLSGNPDTLVYDTGILPAAWRTDVYFSLLAGKRIGLVANQTSRIGNTHLVDSLVSAGITIIKIYTPEHGFRGNAAAGEHVYNQTDSITGLPLISLYGDHRKPTPSDLKGIDLMVFDIQDVGVRFYTYISTLALVMEACAEQQIPLLVLDRPNPNGFYVDGPVLEKEYATFVGMHPVPIVYGMTMAEYARMVNGEKWLNDGIQCKLNWIPLSGYDHSKHYRLPVRPSPNLPDMESVYLYPFLCLFEGTFVSVGRGTEFPFSVFGYPENAEGDYRFTPRSVPGVVLNPPYNGVECRGYNLRSLVPELISHPGLRLTWLIGQYTTSSEKDRFFSPFFDKLAGTDKLRKQIESGMTEQQIRETWNEGLDRFKKIRIKYLLYPDF